MEMEDLREDLNVMDKKVSSMLEKQENYLTELDQKIDVALKEERISEFVSPGTSIKFIVKSIFFVVAMMAAFIYMVQYPIGIIHYATLALYILVYYLWGFYETRGMLPFSIPRPNFLKMGENNSFIEKIRTRFSNLRKIRVNLTEMRKGLANVMAVLMIFLAAGLIAGCV
ncbi:MAG: hypothetical protein ACXQTD_05900 [Candidatus Syntropharchaeia archaeon]